VHSHERDGARHRWRSPKGDLLEDNGDGIEGRALQGEFLRTAKTVNTMVDQLRRVRFGSDARGARGGHGRKARRPGESQSVAGTWKDLTENVNLMGQPDGAGPQYCDGHDCGRERRLDQENHGRRQRRVLELKDTVNVMVDQLRSFASEVTRVAREVGSEGILAARRASKAFGNVEGSDGFREFHGAKSDRPRSATSRT